MYRVRLHTSSRQAFISEDMADTSMVMEWVFTLTEKWASCKAHRMEWPECVDRKHLTQARLKAIDTHTHTQLTQQQGTHHHQAC